MSSPPETLLEAKKKDYAKAYIADMQANHPEIYHDIKQMVDMVMTAVHSGRKPKHKIETLKALLAAHPTLNPLRTDDTYGIRAYITAIAKDKHESAVAKRFYDRVLDALLRDTYRRSTFMPNNLEPNWLRNHSKFFHKESVQLGELLDEELKP